MKITPKQIEVINIRDLFPDSVDALENILGKFNLYSEEYSYSEDDGIRNRCMWSVEEFTYFIDHEINSRLYDIQDTSFVYHTELWISARQVANHWLGCSESRKRFDAEELLRKTEEYNSFLKAKEFLSAHPKCYVFNGSDGESSPWSIKKMTVVSYELLVEDSRDWNGVWDNHADEFALLLSPNEAIEAIEEYIEESYEDEKDHINRLKKVVKRIKKNGANVIVHDYLFSRNLKLYDLIESIHSQTSPVEEESLKDVEWKHRAEIKEESKSWNLYSDASFQQWHKRSSEGEVEYCNLNWDMSHYMNKYWLYELRNWKFVSEDKPARYTKIDTLPATFHYV